MTNAVKKCCLCMMFLKSVNEETIFDLLGPRAIAGCRQIIANKRQSGRAEPQTGTVLRCSKGVVPVQRLNAR